MNKITENEINKLKAEVNTYEIMIKNHNSAYADIMKNGLSDEIKNFKQEKPKKSIFQKVIDMFL